MSKELKTMLFVVRDKQQYKNADCCINYFHLSRKLLIIKKLEMNKREGRGKYIRDG